MIYLTHKKGVIYVEKNDNAAIHKASLTKKYLLEQ